AWLRHVEGGSRFRVWAFSLTRGKLAVLLAIFLALTLASALEMYSAHSKPVREENVVTLARYAHEWRYDYVAKLKPNELYENRLTLRPGEGVLYIKILEGLDVTFRYTFTCDRPASISTSYSVGITFEAPEKWVRTLAAASENSVEAEGRVAEFSVRLPLDLARLDNLRRRIEEETGTTSSSYDLRIRPTIHTVARTDVGAVDEVLTPELVLSFKYRSPEGDYIAVSGLENRSFGAIYRVENVYRPEVAGRRRASYAMMAVSLIGLALVGVGFARTRPPRLEKPVEEMVKPFKEAVIEAAGEPEQVGATVAVKSLEDLAAIAEGLGKPILHFRAPARAGEAVHSFFVLDGTVKYEFKIKSKEGYWILR
ncbi:MAG: DUF5305 domain-containing protein, partial [Hadesarchaea archaeon]|nr:DUF5305 domain-containing protein [Hadesarchaea archaeon]